MPSKPLVQNRHIALFTACLVALWLAWPTFAQGETHQIHLTENGLYRLQHPANWHVQQDSAQGFIYIATDSDLALTLYTPDVLKGFRLDGFIDGDSLLRLVLMLNPYDAEPYPAQFPAYAYGVGDDEVHGLLIAVPFSDERWGLVDAYGDISTQEGAIFALAASFESALPARLDFATEAWPEAIAELEAAGMIPLGGSLSFVQNYAFAAGSSPEIIQPIAQQLQQQDVVIHADLLYQPGEGDGFGACGVMLRRNPTLEHSLALSITPQDFVVQDRFANPQTHHYPLPDTEAEATSHRILTIARGDQLVTYVDGAFHAYTGPVSGGAGSFGLILNATGRGARCEVSNLWVYALPVDTVCRVSSTAPVSKHANPGDGDPVVGEVLPGTVYTARLQFLESTGAVWFLLNDDTWVRQDSVLTSGDCANLAPYD